MKNYFFHRWFLLLSFHLTTNNILLGNIKYLNCRLIKFFNVVSLRFTTITLLTSFSRL